jgi:hypothetical protein
MFRRIWAWLIEPKNRKDRRIKIKSRIEELLAKEELDKDVTEELDDLLWFCQKEVIFLERK